MPRQMFATFLLTAVIISAGSTARAVDVEADVSTRETYVNVPITLQIQINNAVEYEQPVMPAVDGLEIKSLGAPSRSYRVTTINGRRTQRTTMAYQYSVTPIREGTFTIPPVKVVADGRTMMTKATRIIATKSETDDLLFVEIEGDKSEIFVGEALDLTLKIWVRPYRDKEYNITLNEPTMWSLISRQTKWGPFTEALEKLSDNRRRPGGELTLREDSEGDERGYLLFEVEATVYPDRIGEISGDDVRVIVNYPVELGRSRSPFSMLGDDFFGGSSPFDDQMLSGFGSRLEIKRTRPLVAETSIDTIQVKPVPTTGRPDSYRGAVGEYSILTEARPVQVQAGDPITLNIGIDGTGPMDLVRAPPLSEQTSLIREFKVPDEPLAGFVDGTQKVFSTTIRPLNENVTEIPPIEFTYFDPEAEKFVTVQSDPIPIRVEAAEMLALDSISGRSRASSPDRSDTEQDSRSAAPVFLSGPDDLQSQPRAALIPRPLVIFFLTPPLLVMVLGIFARRQHLTGLISAKRRFQRAIRTGSTSEEVGIALEQFLARRFRLPESKMVRSQTVGRLRASDQLDLAVRTERLYSRCARDADSQDHAELKREAEAIVDAILNSRARPRRSARSATLSTSSAAVLFIAFAFFFDHHAVVSQEPSVSSPRQSMPVNESSTSEAVTADTDFTKGSHSSLTPTQQTQLLNEAAAEFQLAVDSASKAAAKELYASSAEKLQLIVDSGVTNAGLFFDLASAQLGAGDAAAAIANYRRSLRYAPANQSYWLGLARAESSLTGDGAIPRSGFEGNAALEKVRPINDVILRFVSPNWMLAVAVIAWSLAWLVIASRIFTVTSFWKMSSACLFLVAVLASLSYGIRVHQFCVDDTAVLTNASVQLRAGDGEEFETIAEPEQTAGMLVRVIDRRDGWQKVELPSGAIGWASESDCEEI